MGKRLIQQARGKGSMTYRAPSHRYKGSSTYSKKENTKVKILDFIHCPAHSAPLAKVTDPTKKSVFLIAAEGIKVGEEIQYSPTAEIKSGNILQLKNIPEGTKIFNIESQPGDDGKFCRSAGAFARVVAKIKNKVVVQFPSKKQKEFPQDCKASIGIVAGGGISEKPILKAGIKMKMKRARNKLYPRSGATSMNAVDHPFGGTTSSHKGKPTVTPRGAPPGRKVGLLRATRTGRRKGKR